MANEDLIDGVLDVEQLADDLRAAHTRIDALTQSLRLNNDALGRIAAAAGMLDVATLNELADGVIAQLNISALTAPLADAPCQIPPGVSDGSGFLGGLACEVCGNGGAVDMDGAVLCSECSGNNALAEARQEGILT
jgi:hypothetical protein